VNSIFQLHLGKPQKAHQSLTAWSLTPHSLWKEGTEVCSELFESSLVLYDHIFSSDVVSSYKLTTGAWLSLIFLPCILNSPTHHDLWCVPVCWWVYSSRS
jgi:hypothetical protein